MVKTWTSNFIVKTTTEHIHQCQRRVISHYFLCVKYGWQKLHKHDRLLWQQQRPACGHTVGPFPQNRLPAEPNSKGNRRAVLPMPFQIAKHFRTGFEKNNWQLAKPPELKDTEGKAHVPNYICTVPEQYRRHSRSRPGQFFLDATLIPADEWSGWKSFSCFYPGLVSTF